MSQKITVVLSDDLTDEASDDVETVEFGLDGVTYEIDLSAANALRLRDDVLGEFLVCARRTGGRVKRGLGRTGRFASATGASTRPDTDGLSFGRGREQTQAIRDWARQNGYQVSDRGRIPAAVVDAFDAAHAVPATQARTGRRSRR